MTLSELVESTRWTVEPAPARPARPFAPVAPRPFSQLARRHWRMHAGTYFGYTAFITATPWYSQRRRYCAFAASPLLLVAAGQRRAGRARLRRATLVVTRLPAPLYDRAQVA